MAKAYQPCEKQPALPEKTEQSRCTISASETETHTIVLEKTAAEKTRSSSQTCLIDFYEVRCEHIERIVCTHAGETAGCIAEPDTTTLKLCAGKEKTAAKQKERTAKEKQLTHHPRGKKRCRRMEDIPELTSKESLERILRQEKTPVKTAAYLDCSKELIYRAMKKMQIPTARAYAPEPLEEKLHLKKIWRKKKSNHAG